MPSPKYGSLGAALMPACPKPAVKAATDKAGTLPSGTSTPVPHQPVTVKPAVFKPSVPTKPASESPAPKASASKPCDISELSVNCGHSKKRQATGNGVLQIVPKTRQIAEKYSAKFFSLVEVSGDYARGGQDQLDILVKSMDGKASGRKEICLKRTDTPPSDGEWISGERRTETIQATKSPGIWLAAAQPVIYVVHGRGCTDDNMHRVAVEVFPSEEYGLDVSVEGFRKYYEEWNMYLELFNKATFGAVDITQTMQPPTGKFRLSLGWKENDDYRAYYNADIGAALDPVWGTAFTGKISFTTLIATASGGPLAGAIAKLIAKRADGYLSITLGFAVSITGNFRAKRFTLPETKWTCTGSTKFAGKGSFTVALGVKATVWTICVKIEGRISTDLILSAEYEVSDHGIKTAPKLTFGEIWFKIIIIRGTHEEEEKPSDEALEAGSQAVGPAGAGENRWDKPAYSCRLREKEELTFAPWQIVRWGAEK